MDDTTSDPGTFVSVENFLESPAPNIDPLAPSPPLPTAQNDSAIPFNSNRRDSSFMWTLFQDDNEFNSDSANPVVVDSDAPESHVFSTSSQNEQPIDDEQDDSYQSDNYDDDHSDMDEADTATDASDLCIGFEDAANLAQTVQDSDWLQTPHFPHVDNSLQDAPHISRASREGITHRVEVEVLPANAYPQFIQQATAIEGSSSQSPLSHNDVPCTPISKDEEIVEAEEEPDTPDVAHIAQEISLHMQNRLISGTDGIRSFLITNPFGEIAEGSTEKKTMLYSKEGPLTGVEVSYLQQMADNLSSAESRVLSKLFETISFQQKQFSRFEDTAVALSDGALHSAAQQFGNVERRRSFAMNALISELDVERNRSYDMETENQELRDRLEFAERRLEEVEEFCKKTNPAFSFEKGVDVALKDIVFNETATPDSPQEVVDKSAGMDELSRRLLRLDATLSETRKRSDDVLAENAILKEQLATHEEGVLDKLDENSPLPERQSSPYRTAVMEERDELVAICKEQKDQIETLHEFLATSAEEKKKVNDAFLSLNVDMEMARTRINTLQNQRDTAERGWRDLEKLRSSERKTYHEMCSELSQNIVAAVNDLNQMESKVNILTREVEDRESMIQSLQVTINELEEQMNALTDAAISKVQGSQSDGLDGKSDVSDLMDTVVANLRGELERSQALLAEKTSDLTEMKRRVVVQDEVRSALHRECDRYRSIAEARRSSSHSPSRRVSSRFNTEEQQNMFLQHLSETLGCRSENSNDLVGKLITRVENLLKERSDFESSAVKLRNEVLDRERTLHVVRSEMQAEISTLKAEVQHLENVKTRAAEECKFAEDRVLELLGEKDLTKADSIGDVTTSSLGTRRQSGYSDIGSFARRDSLVSSVGADNTIHWNDPLVAEAIQSLSDLTDMKDRIGARYRALRERLDRMIRRGEVDGNETDAKALMIESREIQADLSGVVDMQQDIINTFRPKGINDVTSGLAGAENTLSYVAGRDWLEDAKHVSSASHGSKNRDGFPSVIDVGEHGEATGFLREQLKQTRDLYTEKSRANAQLCGAVAELTQELEHILSEKKTAEDFLAQVSENHNSFVSRLSGITGTDRSMVAIEYFVQSTVQDMSGLSEKVSTMEQRLEGRANKMVNIIAQKNILSHIIYTYQSKYKLDLLMSSAEEKTMPLRRFRTHAFAIMAGIKLRKLVSENMKSSMEEIDISSVYNVPSFGPIGRMRAAGPSLLNASVAIAAVPRLEAAIKDRERRIDELKSAMGALDNTGLPSLPEDVRNSIRTSFAYDEDVLTRKQDLARRLRKTVKEKTDLEVRFSREKEVRIALEAKLSRYSERLVTAKKRLAKASSHADSKERTYKAAIKYLKQKADKAIENDFSIDENTDPWVTPDNKKRIVRGEKSGQQIPNAKSLMILEAEIKRLEGDMQKAGEGSAEYEDTAKHIHGLHKAMQRLRQTRKPSAHAPSVMNSNLIA